ncbi:CH076 protein [Salmo salar]|uniref:C8orf76 n=1 Tax=Salmo salar TaxID=8030 RepID=B5XFI5_SALSA|nr:CH076 protein [Salmo salar]ACI69605.1 C8orf76 [Salmo salar]|eukprot:NP_001134945.1 CH076 protein [Salmo salar]
MEIFGSTFDDSVFEESRAKPTVVALSSYNAKFCEAEWFWESIDTEDILEKQKIFKFRADMAYRRKNFQEALNAYTTCLSYIPDGNLTIRRDIMEGMARCCCHLGKRVEALEITETLKNEASNTCHLTGLLHLTANVHERFGDLRSQVTCLQQLCSLHPYHQWHWMKLAQSYLHLLQSLSSPSGSSPLQRGDDSQTEEQLKEERDGVWLKACMCFVRARLVLRALKGQQSSFVLQNSERALQKADEALRCLEPKDTTLQLVSEVMSEDVIPERMREDNQDGESLAGLSLKDFEDRWWNRLVQTGVLKKDGPKLPSVKPN